MNTTTFRPAAFAADWLPDGMTLPGFTHGNTWNGWACPEFEMAEAQQIADLMAAAGGSQQLTYDADRDAWLETCAEYADEAPAMYRAKVSALPDGRTVKTYGIGSFAWCWDELNAAE